MSATMLKLLTLAVIFELHINYSVNGQSLYRQNYGVVFHELGGKFVSLRDDSYDLTFSVPLPELHTYDLSMFPCHRLIEPDPDEDSGNETYTPYLDQCKALQDLLEKVYADSDAAIENLNKTVQEIKLIIPEYGEDTDRDKRKVLGFISEGLEMLIGSPSHRSWKKLRNHVSWLHANQDNLQDSIGQIGATLESFMKLNDHKYHKLVTNLMQNNQEISRQFSALAYAIKKDFFKFISNQALFKAYQVKLSRTFLITFDHFRFNLEIFNTMQQMHADWIVGINTLLKHYLPANLISPSQLLRALNHISEILLKDDSDLKLSDMTLSSYYDLQTVSCVHDNVNLYIHLSVPLVPKNGGELFRMYQTMIFPLPITHTKLSNLSSTEIQNLSPFYGVSIDNRYSIQLSTETWTNCKGNTIISCSGSMILHYISNQSCLDSLYFNHHDAIIQSCVFKFRNLPTFPALISFDSFVIAISQTQPLLLSCPDKLVQKVICSSICLIKIKCKCQLQNHHHVYLENHVNCEKNIKNFKLMYIHNIVFLHKVLGSVPKNWTGDLLALHKDITNLPPIPDNILTGLNDNLLHMLSDQEQSDIDFVMERIKNGTQPPYFGRNPVR